MQTDGNMHPMGVSENNSSPVMLKFRQWTEQFVFTYFLKDQITNVIQNECISEIKCSSCTFVYHNLWHEVHIQNFP